MPTLSARRLVAPLLLAALPAARPAALAAQAAPRPSITQTLSTNPLATPFGFVSGEYERALGRLGLSFGVGAITSYGSEPQALNDGGSDVFRSLQLKLKYHPRQEGLRGFSIGLTAGVAHERELWHGSSSFDATGRQVWHERVTRARTAPTIGTTVDYNLFLGRDRRFLVGLGVGARRPLGVSRGSGPLSAPIVDPRLQFGFGF
jgi:hypothetical protein